MRYRFVIALLSISAFVANPLSADEAKEVEPAWAQPKMPAVIFPPGMVDWYPPVARRCNIQGRVLVGFDVTPAGVVKKTSIIWAEDEIFSESTIRGFASLRFAVPDDWATTGAWRRWRAGVVYRLAPSAHIQAPSYEFAIPVESIYVTGGNIPETHQSGSCPRAR
ncbi:MAG: energy transducer TonB [Proteobacteria bacterium]|nr:energy transducer TonB [Pseudomonadota bacterium]